jgi:hypothetical protein
MKRLLRTFAVVLFALTAGGLLSAQSDPFAGTWKVNLAKSKYDPGPAPQSQTRTWDPSGNVSVEGTNAAGKPVAYGYPIKPDSKDYPTTGAVPSGADTIAAKRIDANTVEVNFKKGGKHVETARFAVSKGGKVLTITANGVDPKGQSFSNLVVCDRQ